LSLFVLVLFFLESPASAATYSVTFTETGLPSGASWSVSITGVSTQFSNTNTITYPSVTTGSYTYSIANITTGSCVTLCMYHPVPSGGSITVSTTNVNVATTFTERFYMTVAGGSGGGNGQGWYNVGSSATVTSQGVWGRAAGTGFRVTSYNVDGGSNTPVATPSPVSVTVTMNAPHTVAYARIAQYQVTLDGGAVAALRSISLPTLANDNYWYDSGTAVSLVLNGVWARSSGTGYRLASFTVNGQNSQAATTGSVNVLALASISSPEVVTTFTTTQYQLTIDGGATGALSSLQPPPPIGGDNYWYDGGTAVQYVGQGVFGRASGSGQRVTSWWFDLNSANSILTHGAFTGSITMYSSHSLHTTTVVQFQVSLNGTYWVYSITPPTLSGDAYWYDRGSSVSVVLNGTFSRSAGHGNRMTGYSLNGGSATAVATVGHVNVLNLANLGTPQTVAVTSVTQFQVALDSTCLAALNYITPPTIGGDTYWYDSETAVTLSLNGVWNRASGSGLRLTSYTLDTAAPASVSSTAALAVFSQVPIKSPQSVRASDLVQYQLTVNGGSGVSYTVAPQIPGDSGWYDSGTALQVSSLGVYSRNAGSGERVISWQIDGGPGAQVTTAGAVLTPTITMTSAHVVDFGTILQYEVTLNQGAMRSLRSISPPTIAGDSYWYDAGWSVAVVLNGTGSIGQGTRYHTVSYSVDGAAPTVVSQTGSLSVFSVVSLNSPHAIAASTKVQFLLVITGGDRASASVGSPTGDGWYDNGTSLTVSSSYIWNVIAGQSRQSLTSYTLDGMTNPVQRATSGVYTTPPLLMARPHSLGFDSVAQYYVTFAFTDNDAKNPVTPSSIQLNLVGIGTVSLQNRSAWLDAGTSFSIASVVWHGVQVGSTGAPQSYLVDRPLGVSATTRVYSAVITVVDLFGIPVSGASAQISLANGTSVQETSKSDGTVPLEMIPGGSFHAFVTNLGLSTTIDGDASAQTQYQARVTMSFALVGAIVVAIVAVAAVVLFLVRRSGRSQEPPKTDDGSERSSAPPYVYPLMMREQGEGTQ
jgi:hypothetical protein